MTAARSFTITELLRARAGEHTNAPATFHRLDDGRWTPTTWGSFWEEVQRAAALLRARGLRKGDPVAIMARTCREWQVAELGAVVAGAVVMGVDPQASAEQVAWLLDESRASGIVADRDSLAKIPPAARDRLRFAFALHGDADARAESWREAVSAQPAVADTMWTADPDDPVMLIYTSGTTGTPKGIQYLNRQILTACWAMRDEFPDFESARLVCWLPMAALFQRMMNLLAAASHATTYFVEDPRDIVARLAEIRPTIFTSVPRFYEKLHDGIQAKVAAQKGVARVLADAALEAGAERARAIRNGTRPPLGLRIRHAVLDRLVLKKIRAVMGGELKWMISGSAAAPLWLLEFFHGIGLLLLEAYGVTENPIPVAANRPDAFRFGSVGRPFLGNDVRLTEEGEVIVRSAAAFTGYLGDAPSADRFTADGYYRTGDSGRTDADGFLYLTGRLSDVIKTSSGRRISPVAVENVYRESRYVDQIVVVGHNRAHLVGLIVPNEAAVRATLGLPQGGALDASSAVHDLIERDLGPLGEKLARHERIRAFAILPTPFSVERGEVTPTLKLRRDRIEAGYQDRIAALYESAPAAAAATR